ncbi:MAG: class I SAM-dependent methyltransferase [Chloroflexota bacterium]
MRKISRLAWLYGGNAWLIALVPSILKFLSRLTYNRLATKHPTPDMVFMNLGFIGNDDEPGPALDVVDEPNRLSIQLYHHVGTLIDISGRDVLEVGCGRGGGASYIKRYLKPASMMGIDLADRAIDFCRQMHPIPGLGFRQGDAERIPFKDHAFEVVMNVESSHNYPSLETFFREVKRVLRPGGHFLYTDFLLTEALPERRELLKQAGFELVQERDIRLNVLAALDSNTAQRVALAETLTPVLGSDGARQWTVTPGSKSLEGLRSGVLTYVSMDLIG